MIEKYGLYGLFYMIVVTLFLLFSIALIGPVNAMEDDPVYVMEELGDAEMSRISAGQYLVFARVEVESSRDIPHHDPPSMYLDTLTIKEENKGPFSGAVTRSPQVTFKDLNGTLWAMEETVIGFDQKPIHLWLVIDVFKIYRGYFDMGLERYGWELVDTDYAIKLRDELNAMNLKGVDDKPLTVDTVVHQIAYDPIGWEQLTLLEPTYHPDGSIHGLKSTYVVQECFYRRGYWVVLKY